VFLLLNKKIVRVFTGTVRKSHAISMIYKDAHGDCENSQFG